MSVCSRVAVVVMVIVVVAVGVVKVVVVARKGHEPKEEPWKGAEKSMAAREHLGRQGSIDVG